MPKKIISACLSVVLLLTVLTSAAQDSVGTRKPEMADALRSSGKIWVVVAVLITILAGLFLYVIQVDRRISRLEK